jgi:hypothetical protein
MLFMKIGENSYRSNRMYKNTQTNRKFIGALKRADRNDFGFGGRDPWTYEQAERGNEIVRQSKVQMKGLHQRRKYEKPKDQAKYEASKRNLTGDKRLTGQYIQKNWKKYL